MDVTQNSKNKIQGTTFAIVKVGILFIKLLHSYNVVTQEARAVLFTCKDNFLKDGDDETSLSSVNFLHDLRS